MITLPLDLSIILFPTRVFPKMKTIGQDQDVLEKHDRADV